MKKAAVILMSLLVGTFLVVGSGLAPAILAAPAVPVSVLTCPQGPPTPGLVPQYGGTLEINYTPASSNPGLPWKPNSPFDAQCNRYAIEGLVGLNDKGMPVPMLATGWESDMAKKTIMFTLRQGVNFHDGTPFNAEAVKFCLEQHKSSGKPEMKDATSIEIIDDYHLRIKFSSWNPLFIQQLCSSAVGDMVSPTSVQKLGDEAQHHPVGTGPFKFVSFEPKVSLKYKRWEGYWQKGLPYLDAVEITFVKDPLVALTSFVKGEAHVDRGITTSDAKKLKAQGFTVDGYIATIMSIVFDTKNPDSPFADKRVRQAIAYAIDTDTIVNSVYDGIFPPTHQLAAPGKQAYDSSIKAYPYNPDKAKELLKAAGYGPANPLKTKLVYVTDPQRADCFTAVQGYLAKVGIRLTLEAIDQGAYNKIQNSGWNNHLLEYRCSYNGLEMQYSTTLSQNLAEGRQNYPSLWTAPDEFTKLFEATLAENDMAKREENYKKLNKIAIDDYCIAIPLVVQMTLTAKSADLVDLGMCKGTSGEFLPERAWLKK